MESGETARVEQRGRGDGGLVRRIKKGSNGKKREIKKPVQSDGRDASLRINR